jgi:hypothetical protein
MSGSYLPNHSVFNFNSGNQVAPITFLFQLSPYGNSPNVTSSLTRRLDCRLWICLAFFKCTYCTYRILLKILPFTLYLSLMTVKALQSRSCNSDLRGDPQKTPLILVSTGMCLHRPAMRWFPILCVRLSMYIVSFSNDGLLHWFYDSGFQTSCHTKNAALWFSYEKCASRWIIQFSLFRPNPDIC